MTKPLKLSNTVRVSRSGTSSCIRCGLKLNTERNNRGIDELKAGDVTNNIFGTERHCWSRWPGPAPPQASPPLFEMSAVGRVAALRRITFCHEPAGGSPQPSTVNHMMRRATAESHLRRSVSDSDPLEEPPQCRGCRRLPGTAGRIRTQGPATVQTNQFRFF